MAEAKGDEMERLEDAQRLFSAYQKNGEARHLRDSLDILDEIIESASSESQKASNFKNTISKHIDNQINGILAKCNIREFAKDLKAINNDDLLIEKLSAIISSAFSKEDGEAFIMLLNIKSDYFNALNKKTP